MVPIAILVTLFCCCPFGLVAISSGLDVSRAVKAGNLQHAREYSEKAMFWIVFRVITNLVIVNLILLYRYEYGF